jgi:hypothetical protein
MTLRSLAVASLAAGLALAVWSATPTRAKSLAQFDAGFAQCEKRDPELRGQGDAVYASLYRLRLDDALRNQLAEARKSAPYRADRRRAQQTLAKNAAASDVSQRLDLQCQALKRELKATPAHAAAASAAKR